MTLTDTLTEPHLDDKLTRAAGPALGRAPGLETGAAAAGAAATLPPPEEERHQPRPRQHHRQHQGPECVTLSKNVNK